MLQGYLHAHITTMLSWCFFKRTYILTNQNQNFQTMTKNVGLLIGHCSQVSAWAPYLLEIECQNGIPQNVSFRCLVEVGMRAQNGI